MAEAGSTLLHRAVARELGIEIIEETWPVGAARTLEDIQERFAVSRTVARESSRQLKTLGLARAKRRTGIVALTLAEWNVLDPTLISWRLASNRREAQIYSLTQLRLAVEPAAAESAARLGSIHARARLLPLAAELRRTGEAGDLREFMRFDIEFHQLLLESCGNEMFAALAEHVAVVLQGRTEMNLMPAKPKAAALDAHEAVAEAVFRGEAEAARAAMLDILDEVRSTFSELEPRRRKLGSSDRDKTPSSSN